MTEKKLNIELQKLQAESVNNGGIWRFTRLALDKNKSLKELYQTQSGEIKISIINTNQQNEIINNSIEKWSSYSGPCPERFENSSHYEKFKKEFINNIFTFITKKGITDIIQIENFDSYTNGVLDIDSDHLNEDFVFKADNENYILHLGFSS